LRSCLMRRFRLLSASEHAGSIRPWPTGVYLMCAHAIGFITEATTRRCARQPLAECPPDRCNGQDCRGTDIREVLTLTVVSAPVA
jgi:hypothetical protein